ncbi:MAG TPA: SMI1/KNR4 family protein [Actinospica sp.]|jgi:hypothetical protein|nr:SMI1/KNR4 family protein [Actinospica sp.]
MAISDLTAVVPPPAAEQQSQAVDWDAVEQAIGVRLPDDYKDVVALYGDGCFGDFIHLYQPDSPNPDHDLAHRQRIDLEALRSIQEDFPEDVPYRLSEPAELLPAGLTDNGDVIYWHLHDPNNPDGWTLAISDSRDPEWSTFTGGITQFLAEVLTGRTRISVFPKKFPHRGATFERY